MPLLIAMLLLLVATNACSPHVLHPRRVVAGEKIFEPIAESRDVFIGVALSGGGSRAAYFGASALEALANIPIGPDQSSLLEHVTHLSSVSGGSVAASYFVTQKPERSVRVLQNGKLNPSYGGFFKTYREEMAHNYQWGVEWRQALKVRWLNSGKRAASLAEELDSEYLKNTTLEGLYERERRGDVPRLILNATMYNSGRRVVLTTVPREDFEYDVIAEVQKAAPGKKLPKALTAAQDTIIPKTFQDHEIDPRRIPLSYAVAASASFPFLIGPISVQSPADNATYYHVGDGGLFDNQGTESLVQLFLKKLQGPAANRPKRALVLAFDSSFPFSIKNAQFNKLDNGFKIFLDDPSRIVGIMEQRANAYQAMAWHVLQNLDGQKILPDDTELKVIVIRHSDPAIWPKEPNEVRKLLPASCEKEGKRFDSADDVSEHLALIETKFKLPSACDRELLHVAAQRNVDHHKAEILEFLMAP